MDEATIGLFRELAKSIAGILVPNERIPSIESRLNAKAKSSRVPNLISYLRLVQKSSHGSQIHQDFIELLTINKTGWFREPAHFEEAIQHIQKIGIHRTVRIWCAACSYGHEPYSISMMLTERIPDLSFQIIASDIDSQVLSAAQNGVYQKQQLIDMPSEFQKYWTLGQGQVEGWAKIRDDIRQKIKFIRVHLMKSEQYPSGPFDLIFCRNVFIYFDDYSISNIVNRFHQKSSDDALLFLGMSETLINIKTKWIVHRQSSYSKELNASLKTSQDRQRSKHRLILIGSSTGGLEALQEFFKALTGCNNLPPIVIAQHIRPGFVKNVVGGFQKRFPQKTFLVAKHGQTALKDHIYFSPDYFHLHIQPGHAGPIIGLRNGGKSDLHVPSVDRLFESAAMTKGIQGSAIILTGMGGDGAKGIKKCKGAGFYTLVQDPSEAFIDGMPKSAIQTGAVDTVGTLKVLAKKVCS